jgi:hypothetical protein
MSSNPQSESLIIWFLLLDSDTGEPYKQAGDDKVSVSSFADVVDFQKAVKAENSNKLSSIDSSDLLVYKNKADFDKRNAEDGKGEPLESDSLVVGLGTSKIDALIVVVPSSIQAQLSSFTPCKHAFFNNICNTPETDGWLSFGESIPSTELNSLYIRESYREIATSIIESINKTIITGTPGVGKSLFLMYLLWKLVKDGERVLFIFSPYIVYYDGKGGVFVVETGPMPTPSNSDFWNKGLWCLFDAKNKKDTDLSKIPYDLCTCIVTTSPRREMVNDFKKSLNPNVFVMPLWTEAELEAIAPLFPNSHDWRNRFEILGGIPHNVLQNTTETPTLILEGACSDCTLDDCIRKIHAHSRITESSKAVHTLVHMSSVPPYTNSSVCYASPTAVHIIVQNKGLEINIRMRKLLGFCEGNPLIAALYGYIFEHYGKEL